MSLFAMFRPKAAAPAATPAPSPAPARTVGPKPGTLAFIVGISAAAVLLVETPKEESGRTVEATVAPDGTATVRHVSGRQYLTPYRDIAEIATACDGITRGVKMGQTYTEAQCTEMLERELVIHATGVMACVPGLKVEGRDNQRVAAVLLAYNIGVGGFCNSTVARRFNAGDWKGGCDAMLMWNKARVNGVLRPVTGLTRRREREREICRKGL